MRLLILARMLLYVRTEGHGFFTDEHRAAFYTQLLSFLGRNIGPQAGATTGASTSDAAH